MSNRYCHHNWKDASHPCNSVEVWHVCWEPSGHEGDHKCECGWGVER